MSFKKYVLEKGGYKDTFAGGGVWSLGLEIFQKKEGAWKQRGGEKIEEGMIVILKETMIIVA